VRERRLRVVVDELTGGDQVTRDRVGRCLAQAAQLVAYLVREVARVDIRRWGRCSVDTGTIRLVVTSPVAPGRSARSAVTVALGAKVVAEAPLVPVGTTTVTRVAALAPLTEAGPARLADPRLRRTPARDIAGRLVHDAFRRRTGPRLYRLIAGKSTALADGVPGRGVEVDGKVISSRGGCRRLCPGAASRRLGARAALPALKPRLTWTTFLAVPAAVTVPIAETPALIAVGPATVTTLAPVAVTSVATVVATLRSGPAVLEARAVAPLSTVVGTWATTCGPVGAEPLPPVAAFSITPVRTSLITGRSAGAVVTPVAAALRPVRSTTRIVTPVPAALRPESATLGSTTRIVTPVPATLRPVRSTTRIVTPIAATVRTTIVPTEATTALTSTTTGPARVSITPTAVTACTPVPPGA
jgi:hypothetical protein